MSRIVVFEDQTNTANRISQLFSNVTPIIDLDIVNYLDNMGVKRKPKVVVDEACNLIYSSGKRSAFLVDLVGDAHDKSEKSREYGLQIIQQLANSLYQSAANVCDFLQDQNFLTVIVTSFELKQNLLGNVWNMHHDEVEIIRVNNVQDIKSFLDNRTKKPMLPMVYKVSKEYWLPPLISGWFSHSVS